MSGGGRLRNVLVVCEVACAFFLLIGAGLMIRSFSKLEAVDPGFNADNVVTMRVALPDNEYQDSEAWYSYFRRLLERVDRLPGVTSAAVNNGVPLASGGTESGVLPDSRPAESDSFSSCLYQAVSADYFETIGISLRRGRSFNDLDVETSPLVAVVDETMAAEFWPGEDPIGRRVAFEFTGDQDAFEPIWREVVGVVGHVRHYEMRAPSPGADLCTVHPAADLVRQPPTADGPLRENTGRSDDVGAGGARGGCLARSQPPGL